MNRKISITLLSFDSNSFATKATPIGYICSYQNSKVHNIIVIVKTRHMMAFAGTLLASSFFCPGRHACLCVHMCVHRQAMNNQSNKSLLTILTRQSASVLKDRRSYHVSSKSFTTEVLECIKLVLIEELNALLCIPYDESAHVTYLLINTNKFNSGLTYVHSI